jgi:predicted DNA-binding protein
MTTKRIQQPMYLDADRAALLDELSAETRVPKAVFVREAIEDLLIKHGKLKPPKRR